MANPIHRGRATAPAFLGLILILIQMDRGVKHGKVRQICLAFYQTARPEFRLFLCVPPSMGGAFPKASPVSAPVESSFILPHDLDLPASFPSLHGL